MPGVLLCGRLPGIRERKLGEGEQKNDFIDETLVKNAGGYMLQEQLAMMSYKKKEPFAGYGQLEALPR